jgi:hypothetical protein
MSSEDMDAGANARTGNRRTPSSAIQDSAREGPARKKRTRDTKLDELDAEQKGQAARLKKKIEIELEFVKGKGVATEPMLEFYCTVCDDILKGETLDEDALVLFKEPFTQYFKGEDVLLNKLGRRMSPCRTLGIADEYSPAMMLAHRYNLHTISKLLASITRLAGHQGLPGESIN